MELKSFFVPVIVLAVLILFIPFRIEHHTLETTQYIFGGLMSAVFLMRFVDITMPNHHINFKLIDYILTPVILVLSFCILIPIGIIAIIIGYFFPRSWTFVGWLVSTIVLFTIGIRLRYSGKIPNFTQRNYIMIANHSSWIDYFLIVHIMGFRGKYKIFYGTILRKYKIWNPFLDRHGIGVNRKSKISQGRAHLQMEKDLKDGYSIAIFPEGTRMRSYEKEQKLLPFKEGTFTTAVKFNLEIVPIVFDWPILYSAPDKPWLLSPHTIKVTVLPRLVTNNHDAKKVMEHAHKVMLHELKN